MARQKHRRKRDHPATVEIDGENEVDDMAIAAQFAALTYPVAPGPVVQKSEEDDNQIDLDEEESCGSDDDDEEEEEEQQQQQEQEKIASDSPTVDTVLSDKEEPDDGTKNDHLEEPDTTKNDDGDDDDDDDDESHIDMTAELAELERMEETGGDGAAPPKTEHELDPYHTPLSELEEKFHLNLTVQDSQKYDQVVKVCEAGTVKNHMVQERTIIVESLGRDGSFLPLDEGSLLVFDRNAGDDAKHDKQLVPLGKIFEVFGPVRKPLYTIRLPSPAEMKARQSQKTDQAASSQNSAPEKKETADEDGNMLKNVAALGPIKQEKPALEESKEVDSPTEKVSQDLKSENCEASAKNTESQIGEEVGITEQTLPEQKNAASDSHKPVDHWSTHGDYTIFLRNHPELMVFYVQDESNIIDADAILRLSAKGCDASNVYDEEVVNVNEMYFSDDEEERQLKGKKNKNRKSNTSNNTADRNSTGQQPYNSRPQRGRGGHRQTEPVPAGFHHQTIPSHHPHHQPAYQQAAYPHWPQQSACYTSIPPPPPPPTTGAPGALQHLMYPPVGGFPTPQYPPSSRHPQAYTQYPPFGANNPPPPPSYPNPNPQFAHNPYPYPGAPPQHSPLNQTSQPTSQQQSDTVYYDYT